jgi:hypothetical protein
MGQLTTGAYCDGDSDNDDDNDDNGAIYGKQYNWYAVMGITTTESATPTTEEILEKKLAPRLACSHIWGLDDSNYFYISKPLWEM